MKEVWKPVEGWETCYRVSNRGRVKSIRRTVRGRVWPAALMVLHDHWRGYKVVWLRRGGKTHKKYFVHRLVAIAFIPNPESKPIVNHKDGVRHNNLLPNLEWATSSENVNHGNFRRKNEATVNDDIPF